jgi:hypothetical protein
VRPPRRTVATVAKKIPEPPFACPRSLSRAHVSLDAVTGHWRTMTLARIPPVSNVFSGNADHGHDPRDDTAPQPDPAPTPALNPEVVRRFHALIEEVTDELMQNARLDRHTCRADAIALLIATSEQADAAFDTGESPLMYLLLEEQQKAAAALGNAGASGSGPAFLRA